MDGSVGIGFGGVEVVVDDDVVEVGRKRQFVLGAVEALLDDLGAVGAAAFKALAQHIDAGRLDEEAESVAAETLLEAHTAVDIHIEDHVLPFGQLVVNLRLEGAIEAVGIDLLVLDEVVGGDVLAELLGCHEKVLHTVALLTARRTRGGGDREEEVQLLAGHEAADDSALAAAAGGTEDNDFTHTTSHLRPVP